MRLNAEHHPVIDAEVRPIGGAPIRGAFLLDIGAGNALVLHSPFVREHQLPGPNVRTMQGLGGGGIGGTAAGRLGRVAELKVGRFTLSNPITLFSEDRAGAYANPAIQGSIGQQAVANCRLFLDYSHGRIILEPTGGLAETFDRASSGLRIDAEGPDYKTFRVARVREKSPGSEAGLRENDVIAAIDDRAAAQLTLGDVLELFERPVTYRLTVRRGASALTTTLTPREMV